MNVKFLFITRGPPFVFPELCPGARTKFLITGGAGVGERVVLSEDRNYAAQSEKGEEDWDGSIRRANLLSDVQVGGGRVPDRCNDRNVNTRLLRCSVSLPTHQGWMRFCKHVSGRATPLVDPAACCVGGYMVSAPATYSLLMLSVACLIRLRLPSRSRALLTGQVVWGEMPSCFL
ncbi:hypothetical protein TNCT_635511 [Trichonephila clavata]|uniref:Uncharacterized protein n=1 Tax=Trichonephila clavata TaxID=2740835 RepID=A0A8X6KQY9_TRICU|nr:hypothetical protein TNCT_635511 [Trichonephila clavata]